VDRSWSVNDLGREAPAGGRYEQERRIELA
jgi:hypothetical protein